MVVPKQVGETILDAVIRFTELSFYNTGASVFAVSFVQIAVRLPKMAL